MTRKYFGTDGIRGAVGSGAIMCGFRQGMIKLNVRDVIQIVTVLRTNEGMMTMVLVNNYIVEVI